MCLLQSFLTWNWTSSSTLPAEVFLQGRDIFYFFLVVFASPSLAPFLHMFLLYVGLWYANCLFLGRFALLLWGFNFLILEGCPLFYDMMGWQKVAVCVCVCVLSYGCPESAPSGISEGGCSLLIRTFSFAFEEAGVVLRGFPGDLSRGQPASQLDLPQE